LAAQKQWWNRVVAECTVAPQALSEAQLKFARVQAALKATKSQVQQVKNSTQMPCQELHLLLILQEDNCPNLNNWYKGYEVLIAYKAQHGRDTCVPRNPLSGATKHKEQEQEAQHQQQQQLKKLSCWEGAN
jgi:hypothetical protein